MATSIDEVMAFLEAMQVPYEQVSEHAVRTGFATDHHRDPDGEQRVLLGVVVMEAGEYVKLVAPGAFEVPPEHVPAVSAACLAIQSRTKLIQFEWSPERASVDPIVEFPLMDAPLTRPQFERALRGLAGLIDEFSDVLRLAALEGRVDLDLIDHPEHARVHDDLSSMLDLLPAEVLAEALERARREGR